MKEIIIFCQQPSDIPLVLSVYESNIGKNNNINIYCTNVKNNYRFFQSLNLDINALHFIPYKIHPAIRNPISFFKLWLYLKYLYKKYFKEIKNTEVYFFAKGDDWVLYYILNKLIKQNCNIKYYPCHKLTFTKAPFNIKGYLKLFLFRIIISRKLKYLTYRHENCFFYDDNRINTINIKVNDNIFSKYKYSFKVGFKTILFIDADLSNFKYINNYNKRIVEILKMLQNKGFKIHRKAHQRLGATSGIENYITYTIPDYILGEFVDVTQYEYVIGVFSNTLSNLAIHNDGVIALAELFDFNDNSFLQAL